jgi:hypothetical protein
MSISRKPRSDSRLKTLPPARQEQIADYASSHSLQDTRAWLSSDGLKTSVAALSEFLSWWSLKQQLSRNEQTVEQVLEQLKRTRPDLTEEELFSAGQSFFSALAIEQRDAKTWKRTQDLRLKRQAMELEEQKFQRETVGMFIDWAKDQQAVAMATSNLSHSDKIERLGQLMFGDDWK